MVPRTQLANAVLRIWSLSRCCHPFYYLDSILKQRICWQGGCLELLEPLPRRSAFGFLVKCLLTSYWLFLDHLLIPDQSLWLRRSRVLIGLGLGHLTYPWPGFVNLGGHLDCNKGMKGSQSTCFQRKDEWKVGKHQILSSWERKVKA